MTPIAQVIILVAVITLVIYYNETNPDELVETFHRKILGYIPYIDDYDADGHGTHVAGSLAGYDGS